MAITRKRLNSGASVSTLVTELSSVLVTTLGIATSVSVMESDSNALEIDADGVSFRINTSSQNYFSGMTGTCKNDNSYKGILMSNATTGANNAAYLINTSTSAVLILNNTSTATTYQWPIIFTKTNNDKLAVIVSDASYQMSTRFPGSGSYYVFSGDDYTIQTVGKIAKVDNTQVDSNQTQLVPFLTLPGVGVTSYTPTAYHADISNVMCNGYLNWDDYILGTHHYLTNGGWWLKDDPV